MTRVVVGVEVTRTVVGDLVVALLVGAFVDGLEGVEMRAAVEGRIDEVGWRWEEANVFVTEFEERPMQ